VRVTRLDTGPCALFLKLESQNPGGSIKDRIGLSMIEAAERDGRPRGPGAPWSRRPPATPASAWRWWRGPRAIAVVLVVPDKMSTEKVLHLKALGAEVHVTRSDVGKGHPPTTRISRPGCDRHPRRVLRRPVQQSRQPLAHERSTGPEIWAQMGQDVDAIVCGVGSGGTIAGLTRFFRCGASRARVRARRPGRIDRRRVHAQRRDRHGRLLGGRRHRRGLHSVDCRPCRVVPRAYSIDDSESFGTARELLRTEGILGGSSTGTLLAAALRYCRSRTRPERVVSFVCDTGTRYLSKVYNDQWMIDQGLLARHASATCATWCRGARRTAA
jgi:cystathionine beta-synthase